MPVAAVMNWTGMGLVVAIVVIHAYVAGLVLWLFGNAWAILLDRVAYAIRVVLFSDGTCEHAVAVLFGGKSRLME